MQRHLQSQDQKRHPGCPCPTWLWTLEEPRTELSMETRSRLRTVEAAYSGNGYAPVQGMPMMMMKHTIAKYL